MTLGRPSSRRSTPPELSQGKCQEETWVSLFPNLTVGYKRVWAQYLFGRFVCVARATLVMSPELPVPTTLCPA